MFNKAQVWRQVVAGLMAGGTVRTWSVRDGFGPEFRVESVSRDAIVISPASSGKQRRLVSNSFDEIVDHLNAGPRRSELSTRNSSYSLGILKHLDLI